MKSHNYILLLACTLLFSSLALSACADEPFSPEIESCSVGEGNTQVIVSGDPDDAITGEKFIPEPGSGEEDNALIGEFDGAEAIEVLIGFSKVVLLLI
jgi:hypothetical protein